MRPDAPSDIARIAASVRVSFGGPEWLLRTSGRMPIWEKRMDTISDKLRRLAAFLDKDFDGNRVAVMKDLLAIAADLCTSTLEGTCDRRDDSE